MLTDQELCQHILVKSLPCLSISLVAHTSSASDSIGHKEKKLSLLFCQICTKKGHPALNCYNRHSTTRFQTTNNWWPPSFNLSHLSANLVSIDHMSLWYLDSGATNHVPQDSSNTKNNSYMASNHTLTTVDGTSLLISSFGNSKFNVQNKQLHLNNILLVPKVTNNLLSLQ